MYTTCTPVVYYLYTCSILPVHLYSTSGQSVPIPRVSPFPRLRCGFRYQAYLLLYLYFTVKSQYILIILSFQSHKIHILRAGLGMAWNRYGLSCTLCLQICLGAWLYSLRGCPPATPCRRYSPQPIFSKVGGAIKKTLHPYRIFRLRPTPLPFPLTSNDGKC